MSRIDPVERVMQRVRRDRPAAPQPRGRPPVPSPIVNAAMPDGTPAPFVMTPEQVCVFLQLDGTPSLRRLDRIRRRGLEARAVGDATRFLLPDVLRFLDRLDPPIRRGGRRRAKQAS